MQEWYEHTANTAQPQRETLADFLIDQQLELPQIGPDLQDILLEEITPAEIQESIKRQKKLAQAPQGRPSLCTNYYFKKFQAYLQSPSISWSSTVN